MKSEYERLHILGRSLRPEVEILFRLEMCGVVCVRPNSTIHLFNLYKRSSVFRVLAGSVAPVQLLSFSKSFFG
jgi:hypothetical protein